MTLNGRGQLKIEESKLDFGLSKYSQVYHYYDGLGGQLCCSCFFALDLLKACGTSCLFDSVLLFNQGLNGTMNWNGL